MGFVTIILALVLGASMIFRGDCTLRNRPLSSCHYQHGASIFELCFNSWSGSRRYCGFHTRVHLLSADSTVSRGRFWDVYIRTIDQRRVSQESYELLPLTHYAQEQANRTRKPRASLIL